MLLLNCKRIGVVGIDLYDWLKADFCRTPVAIYSMLYI